MKKYKIELLVILVISIGLAILLPNFGMANQSLVVPEILVLIKWTIIIFVILTLYLVSLFSQNTSRPKLQK